MAPDAAGIDNEIYSATYSGVPVYEFLVGSDAVMRRRQDHWINATHILKIAGFDKPARTRVLEREVQKGVHEKIQGGYGKYQGTWVPLKDGRALAAQNHILDKLRPIFDYVPGDISPPQAPKHTTNSNKPRVPKPPKKTQKSQVNQTYSQMSEDYDNISTRLHDDDSLDNSTIASASLMEEEDHYGGYTYGHGSQSRKRKRGTEVLHERQHTLYADALLDYFMLSASDTPYRVTPPEMPLQFEINRPIDNQNHTALHWGAAMGDINIVHFFLDNAADIHACNQRGETPLIRAVLFTNNYEKDTMLRLVQLLSHSITHRDNHGATILHHIAMTTKSQARRKCARYYLDVVLTKLVEYLVPQDFATFVNLKDQNGDTALHIVARHNAKKCIKALEGRGARGDIFNDLNETADLMIQKTHPGRFDPLSSSPVASVAPMQGHEMITTSKANGVVPNYHSQVARSFTQSFTTIAQDHGLQLSMAFESEVREKDEDLSEGQRVQQQAENERQVVRQAMLKHFTEGVEEYSEEEERRMREEEQRLVATSESLSEQIQHKELHHAIRSEEQVLSPSIHQRPNGIISDDAELEAVGLMAMALAAEQHKRRKLTSAVVDAEAAAGMSPNGEKCKTLISLTCGVPTEQVPELVPELLEELQASKMEVGNEVAVMA